MEKGKSIFDAKVGEPMIYDGFSYMDMVDSASFAINDDKKLSRPVVIFKDNLFHDMRRMGREFKSNDAYYVKDDGVTNMGAYLEYHLTYVVPKVLSVKYPDQPALELFSVSNEGELEKVILRRMKTYAGKHTREIENKTNPKGVISVSYSANGIRVEDFGAISTYTQRDLLRSARLNDPLDSSLIQGHDESYKRWINEIAFTGMKDEQNNTLVEGLLNNSNVASALSIDATYAFNHANATGFQMYKDIKGLYEAMGARAGGNPELMPDTIVTSPRVLLSMRTTTYGTSTVGGTVGDVENINTVEEMVRAKLGISEIRSTNDAVNLDGTGTTDRLCMFKRTPDSMVLHIPKPLTFGEIIKPSSFRYQIESEFFVAGLNIFRDTSWGYLKGC
jgi:hypothetical protein